jgi:hypothetical protein
MNYEGELPRCCSVYVCCFFSKLLYKHTLKLLDNTIFFISNTFLKYIQHNLKYMIILLSLDIKSIIIYFQKKIFFIISVLSLIIILDIINLDQAEIPDPKALNLAAMFH